MSDITMMNVSEPDDPSRFAVIASDRAVQLMREVIRGRTYADWQKDVAEGGMTERDSDAVATAGTEMLLLLASVIATHDHSEVTP
jgi:hypothetical protein